MDIKKIKKIIILHAIYVIICISCFIAGRYIRFKTVSGTSDELISGIVLTRSELDKIADKLNITRDSIKSANDLERAIDEGFTDMRKGNELGTICVDEIQQSIADDKEFDANFQQITSDYFESATKALDMAIERAKLSE